MYRVHLGTVYYLLEGTVMRKTCMRLFACVRASLQCLQLLIIRSICHEAYVLLTLSVGAEQATAEDSKAG